MHNFRELKVWQMSMELATHVFELTATFPKHELYGITSQLNRSCVSIPSNIAEGSGRNSDKSFVNFLEIALGSAYELETQLMLAEKLKLTSSEKNEPLLTECQSVEKMLLKLIQTVKNRQ